MVTQEKPDLRVPTVNMSNVAFGHCGDPLTSEVHYAVYACANLLMATFPLALMSCTHNLHSARFLIE